MEKQEQNNKLYLSKFTLKMISLKNLLFVTTDEKTFNSINKSKLIERKEKLSRIFLIFMIFVNIIEFMVIIISRLYFFSLFFSISLIFNIVNLILFTKKIKNKNLTLLLSKTLLIFNFIILLIFFTFVSKELKNFFDSSFNYLNTNYYFILEISYLSLNIILFLFIENILKILLVNLIKLIIITIFHKNYLDKQIIIMSLRVLIYMSLFSYLHFLYIKNEILELKLNRIIKKSFENEEKLLNVFSIKKIILSNNNITMNSFTNNDNKINKDTDTKINKIANFTFNKKSESLMKKSGSFKNSYNLENPPNNSSYFDMIKNSNYNNNYEKNNHSSNLNKNKLGNFLNTYDKSCLKSNEKQIINMPEYKENLLKKIYGRNQTNSNKTFDFLKKFIEIKEFFSCNSNNFSFEKSKGAKNINLESESDKFKIFDSEDIVLNNNNLKKKKIFFNNDNNTIKFNSDDINIRNRKNFMKSNSLNNKMNMKNIEKNYYIDKIKAKSNLNLANYSDRFFTSGKNLNCFLKKIKTYNEIDLYNFSKKKNFRKSCNFFNARNSISLFHNMNHPSQKLTIEYCDDISEAHGSGNTKIMVNEPKQSIINVNSEIHSHLKESGILNSLENNFENSRIENNNRNMMNKLSNNNIRNESFSLLLNDSANDNKYKFIKDTSINFENNLELSELIKENEKKSENNLDINTIKMNSLSKENSKNEVNNIQNNKKNFSNKLNYKASSIRRQKNHYVRTIFDKTKNRIISDSPKKLPKNGILVQDNSTNIYNFYNNFDQKEIKNFYKKKDLKNFENKQIFNTCRNPSYSNKKLLSKLEDFDIELNIDVDKKDSRHFICLDIENIRSLGYFVNPFQNEYSNNINVNNKFRNMINQENYNFDNKEENIFERGTEKENLKIEKIYEIFLSNKRKNYDEIKVLYFKEISIQSIKHFLNYLDYFPRNDRKISDIKTEDAEQIVEYSKKDKNQILSKLIHELKTPLNSIIGVTLNIIENNNFEEIENINLLADLSKYATYLINDITQTLNHKLTENYKLNIVKIDLKNILLFCFNILKALLKCYEDKSSRINASFHYDDNLDNYTIYTDEVRLKQILLNLISNSVKFTKRGSIKIQAKISTQNNEIIEIIIKDTGIGIESKKVNAFNEYEENLGLSNKEIYYQNSIDKNNSKSISNKPIIVSNDRIKEKNSSLRSLRESNTHITIKKSLNTNYSNLDKNYTNGTINNEFGTGFGLVIAKKFANRLKHKIELQSVYGEYSEFTIKIFASQNNQLINNQRRQSGSTKKLDHAKTCISGKEDHEFNIVFFKSFYDDEDYINFNNKKESNNFSSLLKNEENNSPKSSQNIKSINPYSQNRTLKLDSKEELEFRYSNFLNPRYLNKNDESSVILDTDLINKILNTKNISKETILNSDFKKNSNDDNNEEYDSNFNLVQLISNSNNNSIKIQNKSNNNNINHISTINNVKNINSNFYNSGNSRKSLYSEIKERDFKNIFSTCSNSKILLIEDQKYIRKSIANLLNLILKKKNLKWEIIEGGDGIDLLNYVIEDNRNNNTVKLIITDENMEFINGTRAIELIRCLESEGKILKKNKIVLTTSAGENSELYDFYKIIGADCVLPKPCNQNTLMGILDKLKVFNIY